VIWDMHLFVPERSLSLSRWMKKARLREQRTLKGAATLKKINAKLLGAVNEPPRSKLRGIGSLILPLPAMGGDQGEGDASDSSAFHPHLTSPIKGEEPIR
jgi:hypothetical protein